jgi:LPXTG-motif cell wall-anchored protein
VPAGGIQCNLPVSKTPSSTNVTAGSPFTVTLRADNPYDCTVKDLKFEDKISAESGDVKYNVTNTAPNADGGSTDSDLTWSGLGSIAPGGHKDVQVTINVPADSPSGELQDTAIVTGTCATGNGPGTANVSLNGTVTLHGPTINGITPHHVTLPNTGSSPWLPIGGGLLAMTGLGLVAARRRSIIG